jgi:hypothetical protein
MKKSEERRPRRSLLPSAVDMRELDSVDNCRMRLLTLRTRIETNWPTGGSFLRRGQGLTRESQLAISALLMALPTPLPLRLGGGPDSIICDSDTDLRAIVGRAVDAGLALLDAPYPHEVSLLEDCRPGAAEPINIKEPTVGFLVSTIIGTLEAISESINTPVQKASSARVKPVRPVKPVKPAAGLEPAAGSSDGRRESPGRSRRVPRI